jgi:hypothetical protein
VPDADWHCRLKNSAPCLKFRYPGGVEESFSIIFPLFGNEGWWGNPWGFEPPLRCHVEFRMASGAMWT